MKNKIRCPQCLSKDIEETLVGIIFGPDSNSVTCNKCQYKGIKQDWLDIANSDDKAGNGLNKA